MAKPLLERFEAKYIPEPNTGCWIWLGAKFRGGYGSINVDGRNVAAHRVAYELYKGPLVGLSLHKCDTPSCVNPDHLFDGTHQDNQQDCISKGRKTDHVGRSWFLSDEQVATIRLRSHERAADLAEEFSVHPLTIKRIRNNQQHVLDSSQEQVG